MIKYFLSLFVLVNVFVFRASAAPDTAVMFFNRSGQTVKTLERADYYMLIMSPIPPDDHYIIQEFFKNGKVKLIGKGDAKENSLKTGMVRLDGDCTTYYPDGNKSALIKYVDGYKDGPEYLYYPNGAELGLIKHHTAGTHIYDETLYWDCYDLKGNKICDGGNGKWLEYDDSCKYIQKQGMVKKGFREGDWQGIYAAFDSIKYIYRYNHSLIDKSEGYDKQGKAYPFSQEQILADYKNGGMYKFVEGMYNRLKPAKNNPQLAISDSTKLSFIVEKNGSISHAAVLGDSDDQSTQTILAALAKCNGWDPTRLFGIPYRTEMIIPMRLIMDHKHVFPADELSYRGHVLKDDQQK